MGKRIRGAALKAKKRAQALTEELQEKQSEEIANRTFNKTEGQELFVLDTAGTQKNIPHQYQRRNKRKEENKKTKKLKQSLSEKDQRMVEKILSHNKLDPAALEKQAAKEKAILTQKQLWRKTKPAARTRANFDLWGEDDDNNSDEKKKETTNSNEPTDQKLAVAPGGTAPKHLEVKPRAALPPPKVLETTVKVQVPLSGQSYHPDKERHSEALQQAIGLEKSRNKAEEYQNTPLATGMSEETKALLLSDSDSDSDDDNDSDGDDQDTTNRNETSSSDGKDNKSSIAFVMPKREEKLTTAQRNKQKRIRQEKAAQERKRRNKRLLSEVGELPVYKKEIKRNERERAKKRLESEQRKEQTRRTPGTNIELAATQINPRTAPSLPVALSDELSTKQHSYLRTIQPKGSLVTDRMCSLQDRSLAAKKSERKRKRGQRNGGKKRRLNVKGRKNTEHSGPGFCIMGV